MSQHWTQIENIVKTGSYKATGEVVYEGVSWDHPRIKIGVNPTTTDQTGSIGQVVIHNDRGEYVAAFGVNHWYWTGTTNSGLYVWPVYDVKDYTDDILKRYQDVIYAGATITVTFTPLWGIVPGNLLK